MDPKHSKIIAGSAIGAAAVFAMGATLFYRPASTSPVADIPLASTSATAATTAIPPGGKQTQAPSTEALTEKDILTIGDSQVWAKSWVSLGIKEAGFTPRLYRCNGVGFVTSTKDCYSYYEGIVNKHWALPTGTPRAIYINASGNDLNHSVEEVSNAQRAVITALKERYPNSTILLAGVVSSNNDTHAKRREYSEATQKVAEEMNVKYVDVTGWQSLFLSSEDLIDNVHLLDEAQHKLADPLARKIKQLLGLAPAETTEPTPVETESPTPEPSESPEETQSPTPEPSESETPSESPSPEATTSSPTPSPTPSTTTTPAPVRTTTQAPAPTQRTTPARGAQNTAAR
ncbi:MAG: GDSL-type esterase/lipase family protein [Rothia sp. (in: high G+C Gram-positive bacteria)]|uniref:SGNH/GDSL hydrolase family protein n=1 Tax=Rothia sp. (in: high G+C Gram-positive bacteria) TaxID=1885016 RepID=UPI0026DEAEB4|nr:GDSL-type esterase/lipase family protein [Rothia sp. (in: high G+C Gram-positive bacteria)]MDO5750913.1 GDSL-type esterase/lipase family protein [Rothia sp. (in: high G+C Gram-positive bacteria)]